MSSTPGEPADKRSDQELVAALNAGDSAAFNALYYRYRDWTVRIAYRITCNADDALDVLQETFLFVAGKFPGFRLSASMPSFLYPVVKNLSIAARRKSQRYRLEGLPIDSLPASEHILPMDRNEFSTALCVLPETQREVVLMRFVDDLSLQEIADALSIPLGTVKSRLHIALSTLRANPQSRGQLEP